MTAFLEEILSHNRAFLAKAITIIENGGAEATELLKELDKHCGKAHLIGVTGPPGAGKSTFISALAEELLKSSDRIGIIAVDPSSPFTGGALLGDRIRMKGHTLNDRIFMRSMGSRGSLGGLSFKTEQVIKAMDAFGMDKILIETVGVGQSEVDIASAADTTIVVLAPGFGDDIQALKAGILEIADIFVVNKGDNPQSEKLINELEHMIMMNKPEKQALPVLKCISTQNTGLDEVVRHIQSHIEYLKNSDEWQKKRVQKFKKELFSIISETLNAKIELSIDKYGGAEKIMEQMKNDNETIFDVAERLMLKD